MDESDGKMDYSHSFFARHKKVSLQMEKAPFCPALPYNARFINFSSQFNIEFNIPL